MKDLIPFYVLLVLILILAMFGLVSCQHVGEVSGRLTVPVGESSKAGVEFKKGKVYPWARMWLPNEGGSPTVIEITPDK